MNEPEFRDWIRGQLSDILHRLARAESMIRDLGEGRKIPRVIQAEVQTLAEELVAAARNGDVASLAIAYIRADRAPITALGGDEHRTMLLGAVALLVGEILREPREEA